jgi:hypothetical protein
MSVVLSETVAPAVGTESACSRKSPPGAEGLFVVGCLSSAAGSGSAAATDGREPFTVVRLIAAAAFCCRLAGAGGFRGSTLDFMFSSIAESAAAGYCKDCSSHPGYVSR